MRRNFFYLPVQSQMVIWDFYSTIQLKYKIEDL